MVDYDGDVYASDESRMLAAMGDKTFRMGNVMTDSYEDIMLSDALLHPLNVSRCDRIVSIRCQRHERPVALIADVCSSANYFPGGPAKPRSPIGRQNRVSACSEMAVGPSLIVRFYA